MVAIKHSLCEFDNVYWMIIEKLARGSTEWEEVQQQLNI